MGEERRRRQFRREATMHFWGTRSKSEYRVSFQELLHSLSQTHGLREEKYKGANQGKQTVPPGNVSQSLLVSCE
jgi:hypothetical protein